VARPNARSGSPWSAARFCLRHGSTGSIVAIPRQKNWVAGLKAMKGHQNAKVQKWMLDYSCDAKFLQAPLAA